eukprot:TRINITY_DN2731_c2_g1_i1.p1 TRINITY_DN2731_c2_g1~~TRINITY_DN2731_c2_g1_i1.p1  ORF type:complete len:192 (-),score=58.48 TRINITY_DN2731_c2_g1_i1:52-627(-)
MEKFLEKKEARKKKETSHPVPPPTGFTFPDRSFPVASTGFSIPDSTVPPIGLPSAPSFPPTSTGFPVPPGPSIGLPHPSFPSQAFPGYPPQLFPYPMAHPALSSISQPPPLSTPQLPPSAPTQSPITKLLLLLSLTFKQGKISTADKDTLKPLILQSNQLILSALEVFEIDQDLEEFIDTLKRICKIQLQH